jgi:putative flippase GtrA
MAQAPPRSTGMQAALYMGFAVLMILLNLLIQNLNLLYVAPWVATHLGHIGLVQHYYLAQEPENYTELVGSAAAVAITYVVKFALDKFVVFQRTERSLKQTSREFTIYFLLALVTTALNIGIQWFLGKTTPIGLNTRIIIALVCGYATKFVLDRKYVFQAPA